MSIAVSPKAVGRWLACAIGVLTLASLVTQIVRYEVGRYSWYTALFDLNREDNLPSMWQAMMLLLASGLLAIIAIRKFQVRDRWRLAWGGLSLVFLILAIDENCSLHEQLMPPLQRWREVSPLFYHGWVVVGLVVAVSLAALFLPFVLSLPSVVRRRVILAGSFYIAGVLGMEMITGAYFTRVGTDNLLSAQLLTNVEELFEMAGQAIFVVALLQYMTDHVPRLSMVIRADPVPSPSDVEIEIAHPTHVAPLEPRTFI